MENGKAAIRELEPFVFNAIAERWPIAATTNDNIQFWMENPTGFAKVVVVQLIVRTIWRWSVLG